MKQLILILLVLLGFLATGISAQVPANAGVQILKAEDARRYDKTLEDLMNHADERVRIRAILAAGRIGDEKAIPRIASMLEGSSVKVREMAAFALGEIESIKAAAAILKALKPQAETRPIGSVQILTGRLVEAAGKIAAANPKDANAKELGEAILDTLEAEDNKGNKQDREVVLLGLTAALRARPEDADLVVMKFLTNLDPRIRADAANTLARLRTKRANLALRAILMSDDDPVARANAARALGAAEDKESVNMLIDAATEDDDSRVRVSAIRSLAALRDAKAAEALIKSGEVLLEAYKRAKKPNYIPIEHSEFIEVATALGRILTNTRNERAVNLFREFGKIDRGHTPEVYIARIRIAPSRGDTDKPELTDWRQYSTLAQVVGEFSAIEPIDDEGKKMKSEAPDVLRPLAKAFAEADPATEGKRIMAGPDVLQAFARFKTADLGEVARTALLNKDIQLRATAAGILGDLPSSKENIEALKTAFTKALLTDKLENDAQLAILDALYKLDKEEFRMFLTALNAPDYLVRKKAFELLADRDLQKNYTGLAALLENAREQRKHQVYPYVAALSTKLGQVLNKNADYRRALSRRNGSVKAVLTTEKGTFTIDFYPEQAPLTVDNFIKLARSKYFNGLEVHRVVPNFVMQDGDPRGDGNGGPGWSIRCEVNMLPYDRGAVGMALSGKDTGGSQWFVTHSPQSHLDGGYTVFGRVNETGMKVVDNIVRGDKIIAVRVIEGNLPQRHRGTEKRKRP